MDKIIEIVKSQLKILGYEFKKEDEETINFLVNKHYSQITYICGLEEIVEPLSYVIADKVCADFLKNKIALGEDVGIVIGSAVNSIKVGDVTVDFPENSSNDEKLSIILDKLERKDFDYSPYSKMRW